MTHHQENYDKTSQAKLLFLQENADIIASLPFIHQCMADIAQTHEEIRTSAVRQAEGNGGELIRKREIRSALIKHILDMEHKIQAYAAIENDTIMTEVMRYSAYMLKRSSDGRLISIAHRVYDMAVEMLTALVPYGLSQAILDDMHDVMEKFAAAVPHESNVTNNTISNTQILIELFRKLKQQWIKVDRLIDIVQDSDEEFHLLYKRISHVEKSRKIPFCLLVDVVESESKTGLPHVKLILSSDIKIKKENIMKKTAAAGGCRYKHFEEGNYSLSASKAGYKEVSINFIYIKGEPCHIHLMMEKL